MLTTEWVLSFRFPLRFLLASYPELMSKVLGIVQRVLSTHLISKAGFIPATAQTGAVTLIQRFGLALNLSLHFHMLIVDGVYVENDYAGLRFHRVKAPCFDELKSNAQADTSTTETDASATTETGVADASTAAGESTAQ